jgi:hypothetical protein
MALLHATRIFTEQPQAERLRAQLDACLREVQALRGRCEYMQQQEQGSSGLGPACMQQQEQGSNGLGPACMPGSRRVSIVKLWGSGRGSSGGSASAGVGNTGSSECDGTWGSGCGGTGSGGSDAGGGTDGRPEDGPWEVRTAWLQVCMDTQRAQYAEDLARRDALLVKCRDAIARLEGELAGECVCVCGGRWACACVCVCVCVCVRQGGGGNQGRAASGNLRPGQNPKASS